MGILTDRMRKILVYEESFKALKMTTLCNLQSLVVLDIQLIGRFKSQIIKENHRRVWFKAYP